MKRGEKGGEEKKSIDRNIFCNLIFFFPLHNKLIINYQDLINMIDT